MSNISNRFYITALEDGTTLHGNLASNKPLVQAWNGSAAVPDWSDQENTPTIYLTLLSGSTLVQPANDFKWLYKGNEIVFDAQNISTGANNVPVGVFIKTTYNVTIGSTTLAMPALMIADNLASSNNKDVDIITFSGTYIINGAGISFSCDAQVRISTMTATGYLGVVNFLNGISDITTKGQTITMYGTLYGGEGGGTVSGFTTKWYLNDTQIKYGNSDETTISDKAHAMQVNESQVVDHATIRCEFYKSTNLLYTAYASIDDMQDPEYMYIQYNGNNGNAASLRRGETAAFQIWVGTRDNSDVLGGATTPTYNTIKVKLLNGDGDIITDIISNIPSADSNGWRNYSSTMVDTQGNPDGKAKVSINYDIVSAYGKNITGIVLATTGNA